MKKKYLIIAIILSVVFIISLILVIRTIISTKKNGNNKQSTVSLENSYLFASPLQAKADGKEKIRLTVFVLSGQGLGVQNQKIEISTSSKITVTKIQATTDNSGKAVFDLTSNNSDKFDVSAKTTNGIISQQVKVSFY